MTDMTVTPIKAKVTVAYLRSAMADRVSLQRQRELCEQHARRLGYQLDAVYSDLGISGRVEHRLGLDQVRRDLSRGHIGCVVTPAPYVLARSTKLYTRLGATYPEQWSRFDHAWRLRVSNSIRKERQ